MPASVLKTLSSLALILAIFVPRSVLADTIFLSPLTGTYYTGDAFSARVMVSSPRQAINAISGIVSFPSDKIQVTSISKIGSILSLWVQEPSFSNSRGTVTFEGVIPNPGFMESNGRVLTINFKVIGSGLADVRLTSGSLLANDGYGTNVLKTLGTASYTLNFKQELPHTPPAVLEVGNSDATVIEPPALIVEPETTLKLELPSLSAIADWLIKFFSILIPLFALLFFLLHTTRRGIGNLRALKRNIHKDLHTIDRLVEKSFDLLKEDVSEAIRILEKARSKRTLTSEEDTIIHGLRRSLVEAENVIHQEIAHAEKDVEE